MGFSCWGFAMVERGKEGERMSEDLSWGFSRGFSEDFLCL